MLKEGAEFINSKPELVIDFLRSRSFESIEVSPSNLRVTDSGELLTLQVMNGRIREFQLRRTFLYKLLKWYGFPLSQLHRLSYESIASVCNDFLMNIKRDSVIIKIEKGDALTIISPDYNEITDLEVILKISGMGACTVSRNDFFLSITTEDRIKTEPIPGDECGIGLNIVNSETGFRALSVAHHVFRYVCSNGAVVKIEEKDFMYHYGDLDLKSFLNERVKEAQILRENIIGKLLLLHNKKVDKEKEYYIRKAETVLGKSEAGLFFKDYSKELTQYELFNLITDRAKNYDLSKRHFLETVAGDIITN